MQLAIFLFKLVLKATICILHWVVKSVSLLEGVRDVKPIFYLLHPTCILYGNPQKMDSLLGKDLSNFFSAERKLSIFPSATLSKSWPTCDWTDI